MKVTVPAFCLAALFSAVPAHALQIHQQIQGAFATSRDVTGKCLECHSRQADDILHSIHWTWERQRMVNGKNIRYGKKEALTGFAIDIRSNPSRCLSCHISSSIQGINRDPADPADIDCIICHDTTGQYRRFARPVVDQKNNFLSIARQVGKPSPRNCITCHFSECGLTSPDQSSGGPRTRALRMPSDVHMTADGEGFSCRRCHEPGKKHSFVRAMPRRPDVLDAGQGCSTCHSAAPHKLDRLNRHTKTIACQTCHIPKYAVRTPVIISWNWLLTGKTSEVFQQTADHRARLKDRNGFTLASEIEPVYRWDNGSDQVYQRGRRIQPGEVTPLQRPSDRSSASRIAPFRAVYGTQLYDAKYRYLISPLLSSKGVSLFSTADWNTVARQGMSALRLPYSGTFGFAPTVTYRRINHGVAPAAQALDCLDCHGRAGRMNWRELGYDQDPWQDR